MATTMKIETTTFAADLYRIAQISVHNEELLKDVNRAIELYKDNLITKDQLVEVCDNVMEQTKHEIKIKQLKVETDYYEEVFKRAYSKTEYIPIVENSITTEEPGDDILESYNYASSEIIYMSDEVTEEIKPDIIIYLDEIDEIKQDLILYDMPKAERDIIIYDIVDNEIIHEEIKEEVQELNEVLYERCCDATEIRIIEDVTNVEQGIKFENKIFKHILSFLADSATFKSENCMNDIPCNITIKNYILNIFQIFVLVITLQFLFMMI